MALEFVACPVCMQKLALYPYILVGSEVVCANCETVLRIDSYHPLRVTQVPERATHNADSRPESYG